MSILRKIVEKKKCEKYAWPEGWMTREQAANDLGVPPRDVDDTLKEAIRDGDVEKNHFSVWDAKLARVIRLPGYRVARADGSAPASSSVDPSDKMTRRIIDALALYPDCTNYEVSRKIHGCTAAKVASVRSTL